MKISFDTKKVATCAISSMVSTAGFVAGLVGIVNSNAIKTTMGLAVAAVGVLVSVNTFPDVFDSFDFDEDE